MSQSDLAGAAFPVRSRGLPEALRALGAERAAAVAWTRGETLAAFLCICGFAILAASVWVWAGAVVPWDSKNHFYPMFRFLADGLARGEIPFWNPYHFGGHPAIADPQSLIFTPSMFLFAWLAPGASMQVFDAVVFAHLLGGALAVLGLFARRGWRWEGAVLAGMIFMLGGPAASRLQHTGIIISYAYLPVAILTLEITLERASVRWAALFGVVAAFMALGRDQVAFLGCLTLLFIVVHSLATSGAPLKWLGARWAVLVVAGVIAAGILAAPSLLTMQFLADSNRPAISYGVAAAGSIAPVNFATLLAPNIFGSLNWTYDYWGPGYETSALPDHTDRAINYLFFGTAPALLVFWHGIGGGRMAGRGARVFLTIGVLALLYTLGRATPFFSFVFDALPGVKLYRRPGDASFLLAFALAMAAGYLLHRYVSEGMPKAGRNGARGVLICCVLAAVTLAAALTGGALKFSAAQNHLADALRETALAVLLFAGSAGALVAGQLWRRRALAAALVVAFTGGELIARNAAASLNAEPASRYVYAALPQTQAAGLDALRRELAQRKAQGGAPRVEILGLPSGWQNASMVLGLENTLGYNPLRISAYARAVGPGENAVDANSRKFPGTFRGYMCELAQLLGIEYLVLDRPLAKLPRHVPRPAVSQVFAAEGMYVYRLRRAAPRAYLATSVKPVAVDDAIAARSLPPIDRTREALVDVDSPLLPRLAGADAASDAQSRVTIVKHEGRRVEIEVEAARAGLLVLHDLHYPGWVARVDGEPRTVVRANLLFRGVEVGAGKHVVTFEYEPLSLDNLVAAAKSAFMPEED